MSENDLPPQTQPQTEAQMDLCMFCTTNLTETNQTVLECGHKGHFRCVIVHFASHYHLDIPSYCSSCHADLVTHELRQTIFERVDEMELQRRHDERTTTNPITHLLESSEDFRKDMKELRAKNIVLNKSLRSFKAKTREHHIAFTNKIKDVLTVLQGTHTEALKNLCQTEEYTNANKAGVSFKKHIQKLCRKYTITERMLYSHFHRNEMRFYRSWWWRRMQIKNILRRKFKIRIY